jgi:cytochrome c oxidase assembly protein Cox11
MNNLTIELMNTANEEVGFTGNVVEMAKVQKLMDKFAELIVKECANVVTETRWHLPPTQQQIAVGIKEHFGVEE